MTHIPRKSKLRNSFSINMDSYSCVLQQHQAKHGNYKCVALDSIKCLNFMPVRFDKWATSRFRMLWVMAIASQTAIVCCWTFKPMRPFPTKCVWNISHFSCEMKTFFTCQDSRPEMRRSRDSIVAQERNAMVDARMFHLFIHTILHVSDEI